MKLRWMLAAAGLFFMVGCQTAPRDHMAEARRAYDAGEYRKAYNSAVQVVQPGSISLPNGEAAYIAGLSAQKLKAFQDAERYLKIASESPNRNVAGQALVALGLVYADRDDYHNSSMTLVKAADLLDGQDKANAYFYAARAELRLSRWANARTYLTLAREYSNDEIFRLRTSGLLGATGFTIQIGVYDSEQYARQVADHLAEASRNLGIGMPRVLHVVGPNNDLKYHVQVGQFSRYDTAAEKRRAIGYNDAVVVLMNSTGETVGE